MTSSAPWTIPILQQRIIERGRRLVEVCDGKLHSDDFSRLRRRFKTLESRQLYVGGARRSVENL
jgi:hypothetical protein